MQSEIGLWVGFCIGCDFREPRARHHDARRGNRIFVERVKAGRINGMCDCEIIRVHNEELRIGGIPQAFRDSFHLSRETRCCKQKKERDQPVVQSHAWLLRACEESLAHASVSPPASMLADSEDRSQQKNDEHAQRDQSVSAVFFSKK
jgi:hypothetical protein